MALIIIWLQHIHSSTYKVLYFLAVGVKSSDISDMGKLSTLSNSKYLLDGVNFQAATTHAYIYYDRLHMEFTVPLFHLQAG